MEKTQTREYKLPFLGHATGEESHKKESHKNHIIMLFLLTMLCVQLAEL